MTRKKDKAYGAFSLYVMADKALLVTQADTPMHLTMTVEPVEVFDYHQRDQFLSAVKRAAARGIPVVEMPPDEDLIWDKAGMPSLKVPIELKYAQVKSWDELERRSVHYTVDCYERGFVVLSCGRNNDGQWNDDTALELRMAPEVGLEGVVDAIIENLNTRRDFPGLMSASA